MVTNILTAAVVAAYAVTLLLEIGRFWLRSGVRPAAMLGFAGAAWLLHTALLVERVRVADALPLSSSFDWYLLAAWALGGVYLYLTVYFTKAAIGLFVLPLVLALVGAAQFAAREPFAKEPAAQAWGLIHGVFLLLGTVAVLIGFSAGSMYLWQAYRLKHKRDPLPGFRFPSLEWLERVNSRALLVSVVMIGLGFASGMILNLVNHQRQLDELPWTDPVIWRSAALLAWLVAAAIFNAVYKPARRGRKVAYLTVASFVFLVASLALQLTMTSGHNARTEVSQNASERSLPSREVSS